MDPKQFFSSSQEVDQLRLQTLPFEAEGALGGTGQLVETCGALKGTKCQCINGSG